MTPNARPRTAGMSVRLPAVFRQARSFSVSSTIGSGLHDFPYRTWLLPMNMANPAFETTPVPFDVALEQINPHVILIDRYARQLFEQTANRSHPYHYLAVGFDTYRARHTLIPRCVVRDATYDTMEVNEVESPAKRGEP
jgi:hypothetical protein